MINCIVSQYWYSYAENFTISQPILSSKIVHAKAGNFINHCQNAIQIRLIIHLYLWDFYLYLNGLIIYKDYVTNVTMDCSLEPKCFRIINKKL